MKLRIGEMSVWRFLQYLWLMAWRPLRAVLRDRLFPEQSQAVTLRYMVHQSSANNGSERFGEQLRTTYAHIDLLKEQVGLFFQANKQPDRVEMQFTDPPTGEVIEMIFRRRRGLTEGEICERMRLALAAIAETGPDGLEILGFNARQLAEMALQICGWNGQDADTQRVEFTQGQRLEARGISSALHEFLIAYDMHHLRVRAERQQAGSRAGR